MAFRYSVSSLTLGFLGYNVLEEPDQILKVIKGAGYDGIDLFDDPKRRDAKKLRQITESLGLKIPQVMGCWGGKNRDIAGENEETRQKGIEYGKSTIDYCVEVGSPTLGFCLPQPSVPEAPFSILPTGTLRKNFVAGLKEICTYAAERSVSVAVEPLNCYESYPCLMNTISEALAVIRETGCSNVALQPDVFHMNIGEASITDALREGEKYIRHIHMNETNHYRFGAGHADFKAIVRTLKEIGFAGYVTIYMPLMTRELFNMTFRGMLDSGNRPIRPDLRSSLESPLKSLKEIEREIDSNVL